MARNYRTGDYCGLTGILTGMIFDSIQEEQSQTQNKSINLTININLNKDKNLNYKDLIKSIVGSLS